MSGDELRAHLRQLAAMLPPEGSVTFSRADLEHLVGDRVADDGPAELSDLTVEELAEELDRAPSTVRGWARRIPGAYRLGREWRFPRAAVRGWLDDGAPLHGDPARSRGGPVDLGGWRDERRAG